MALQSRAGAGFTLVELLVVIAVIGVLIGALLPALSSARVRARQVAGASNIRQLQLANAMYAQDYEHYMPAAIDMFPPTNRRDTENTHRWHGTRKNPSGRFTPEGGAITAYLEADGPSRGVRRCPAFAMTLDELERDGAGFEAGCGGYGYNAAFVGSQRIKGAGGRWLLTTRTRTGGPERTGDDAGAPRHWFASPSKTVAFADAALATDRVVEYSFVEPPLWPDFPGYRPEPSIHFRHGGGGGGRANVAWLDGHVSAESQSHTETGGFYPLDPADHAIGWFGDVASNSLFDYE